jgi:putative MATE family efflux protein
MSSQTIENNQITQGVIWKQLLIFFFPIAAGTFFQQLYNTADAIIVGRFVGKEALASVGGSAFVLSMLIIQLFNGLANGAAVIIAQHFGAKNASAVHIALHTAVAFSFMIGIVVTVAGLILTPWILVSMQTPTEIMKDSIVYVRIFFIGILPTVTYNMGAAVMRAIGDSRRPFLYLVVCCVTNIVLDMVMVIWLHLGIAGAALATVISQTISAILVIHALSTAYDTMKLVPKQIRMHGNTLKLELRIGLPAAIQGCMYGISNIIIQTAVNSLGTDTTAAWGAFGKMDMIFWTVCGAFGVSITTFVGQNYGAGRMDRVYRSVRICLAMAVGLCGAVLAGLILFCSPLYHLFTTDANVIKIGIYMLVFLAPSYMIYVFVEIQMGALRGLGDVFIPTIISLCGVCLVRLPWVIFVTPRHKEITTILISYPLAWASTLLVLTPYYFYKKKKRSDHIIV